MIKGTVVETSNPTFPKLYVSNITGNVLLVTNWASEGSVRAVVVLEGKEYSYRKCGYVYDNLDFPQKIFEVFDGTVKLENK